VGKAFKNEVSCIPQTLQWINEQPISQLQSSIRLCSDRSLIAVGSGGSFTVAAYVAGLHERKYSKLSRAATPLELITGAVPCDVAAVFLSAEGKNNDILAAAQALAGSERGSIVLTLTPDNPLLSFCKSSGTATPIGYDIPWHKDGYLATNSLIATMGLFARAYADEPFDTSLLNASWLEQRRNEYRTSTALKHVAQGASLIVLYGGAGKIAAIDLESKFSEASLGSCQPVDYRQFAHGRHLQLAGDVLPVVIALGDADDEPLVNASLDLFPAGVQTLRISLSRGFAAGELEGVISAMLVIEAISTLRNVDVGQPFVPAFGRALYGIDFRELASTHSRKSVSLLSRKVPHVAPASAHAAPWIDAGLKFVSRLELARFKGVVCDFDGTCCYTARRVDGLDASLLNEFTRLLDGGIRVAFATGRGDSLQTDLREKLPRQYWPLVLIGYCSGSSAAWLDEDYDAAQLDDRFGFLRSWLIEHCMVSSSPADLKVVGGQMSLRLTGNLSKTAITSAIRYWLEENQYSGWRVFCSGHSVDVLTETVGKRNVALKFGHLIGADPEDQILRIGDSGDFGGNDHELLSAGLGLSVAAASPLMASCWNLLAPDVHGAAGTCHYLAALEVQNGEARFSEKFLRDVRAMLMQGRGFE
jgi:fructoselysine-6-P-deglycase FrlB-like protein/hydroxymethylpyrimidine pyrophosphatase-like HAD family hydrolase